MVGIPFFSYFVYQNNAYPEVLSRMAFMQTGVVTDGQGNELGGWSQSKFGKEGILMDTTALQTGFIRLDCQIPLVSTMR